MKTSLATIDMNAHRSRIERDREIIEAYKAGLTLDAIAYAKDLSVARINAILTFHRVQRRYPRHEIRNFIDLNCVICGQKFTVSPSVAKTRACCPMPCKSIFQRQSGTNAEKSYSFRRDGLSWQAIADCLGFKARQTAFSHAKSYAHRRGLDFPPPRRQQEKDHD